MDGEQAEEEEELRSTQRLSSETRSMDATGEDAT
jgi:hypothetical protein